MTRIHCIHLGAMQIHPNTKSIHPGAPGHQATVTCTEIKKTYWLELDAIPSSEQKLSRHPREDLNA